MEPISKAFSKCWRTTFWTVETRKGTEGCSWLIKGNGLKLEHADPRLGAGRLGYTLVCQWCPEVFLGFRQNNRGAVINRKGARTIFTG